MYTVSYSEECRPDNALVNINSSKERPLLLSEGKSL